MAVLPHVAAACDDPLDALPLLCVCKAWARPELRREILRRLSKSPRLAGLVRALPATNAT